MEQVTCSVRFLKNDSIVRRVRLETLSQRNIVRDSEKNRKFPISRRDWLVANRVTRASYSSTNNRWRFDVMTAFIFSVENLSLLCFVRN